MIKNSFDVLWESLMPGGLYFIEDLSFSRSKFFDTKSQFIFVDVVKDWMEQLLTPETKSITYKVPRGLKWILCQYEACVFAKCDVADVARCSS